MSLDVLISQRDNLPRVSEALFKSKYLPMLISPQDGVRSEWLDICIDPRLSVLVVDDRGDVIHRVPPLIYTTTDLTGKNIAGTAEVISKYNEVNPLLARKYASENMPTDIVLADPPEKDVELWGYILERYGYSNKEEIESSDDMGGLIDDVDDW